jgi:uncharacterized protein (DUF1499 family)
MSTVSLQQTNKRPRSALTSIGLAAALVSALLLLSAPIGYRLHVLSLRFALLSLQRWSAYLAAAAAVVSLLAAGLTFGQKRRGLGLAVLGVLVGAAIVALPAYQLRKAGHAPPIHDITTDTTDPPEFVAVLALRANAPNPVAYGGEKIAVQQRRAFPDIVPILMNVTPSQAFDRALDAVRAMGWDLVAADRTAGRIEATDTTFWFGFKDDVVVRIHPADGGSRIDVRSLSRVGGGDIGTNAARIRTYVKKLTAL